MKDILLEEIGLTHIDGILFNKIESKQIERISRSYYVQQAEIVNILNTIPPDIDFHMVTRHAERLV